MKGNASVYEDTRSNNIVQELKIWHIMITEGAINSSKNDNKEYIHIKTRKPELQLRPFQDDLAAENLGSANRLSHRLHLISQKKGRNKH